MKKGARETGRLFYSSMTRIDQALALIERHLAALGFSHAKVEILRHSNHVTVSVGDALVVRAKENQGTARGRMEREVALCRFLSEKGAPATRPARSTDPGPHEIGGWLLSCWERMGEIG